MTDIEQLKAKLEEIQRELETLKAGSWAYKALAEQKAEIESMLIGSGAIAQGNDSQAVGQDGIGVGGDLSGILVKGNNNTVNVNPAPKDVRSLSPLEALHFYLENIIAAHQHLRLQGIRAGSQPLSVSLEKVYVSLTAVDKHTGKSTPGENMKLRDNDILTLADAFKRYRRLVIIGDPGCGENHPALIYCADLRSFFAHIDQH